DQHADARHRFADARPLRPDRHRLALGVLRPAGPPGPRGLRRRRGRLPPARAGGRGGARLGRPDLRQRGRAAGRRPRVRRPVRAVGRDGPDHRPAGRCRGPGAGRDAARRRPRGAAHPVVRRGGHRAGAGRRAVPADAPARRPAGRRPRRGDRRRHLGAGQLDAPLPRRVDDPRLPGRRPRTGDRARPVLHRAAGQPAEPGRLVGLGHARAGRDDAGHPRLRERPHWPLRLHRQPVVEPAARPPDRRPRQPRGDRRRAGHPAGRPVDARRVLAGPPPGRAGPQPRGRRPAARQLRRPGGVAQRLRRRPLLRGRPRRRRPAGRDRRLGPRRGARALPAGRGLRGPPDLPRPGRVDPCPHLGDHRRRGLVRRRRGRDRRGGRL
ncbi:MAG: Predicted dehydrogenases and related proteins, partial [uncultured Friedmanniella sp.]